MAYSRVLGLARRVRRRASIAIRSCHPRPERGDPRCDAAARPGMDFAGAAGGSDKAIDIAQPAALTASRPRTAPVGRSVQTTGPFTVWSPSRHDHPAFAADAKRDSPRAESRSARRRIGIVRVHQAGAEDPSIGAQVGVLCPRRYQCKTSNSFDRRLY